MITGLGSVIDVLSTGADSTEARDSDSIRSLATACFARGSQPRGADLRKPPRYATADGFVINQRSSGDSRFQFAGVNPGPSDKEIAHRMAAGGEGAMRESG